MITKERRDEAAGIVRLITERHATPGPMSAQDLVDLFQNTNILRMWEIDHLLNRIRILEEEVKKLKEKTV